MRSPRLYPYTRGYYIYKNGPRKRVGKADPDTFLWGPLTGSHKDYRPYTADYVNNNVRNRRIYTSTNTDRRADSFLRRRLLGSYTNYLPVVVIRRAVTRNDIKTAVELRSALDTDRRADSFSGHRLLGSHADDGNRCPQTRVIRGERFERRDLTGRRCFHHSF